MDQMNILLPNLSRLDVVVLSGMVLLNIFSSRLGMYLFSLYTLPGTIAHELCHYVTALCLGGAPEFPSLFPKKEGSTWVLGSVAFHPTLINSVPVAMAPTILLPTGLIYADMVMHPTSGWWYVLNAYLSASLISSSMPSRQDFRIALPVFLIIAIALAIAWYLFKN